jgi:type VI secretion system secreted protein VgrG
VTVASGDAFDVREFRVHEKISELFSVTLTAVTSNPDVDFEAIIGQPASFALLGGIEQAVVRGWTGICKDVQEVAVEETGLSTYTFEIVPTLWLATQRRNHRMFQVMSDVDIALQILSEWGVSPITQLSSTYKKRKYRVQYGESDYAFLCRMLEDSGVSFYFFLQDDEAKLVLSDAPQANELRSPAIPFRDRPGDADREHVTALRIGRHARAGRYTIRDHDYRKAPSYRLMASAALGGEVEQQIERFHYAPGAFLFESSTGEPTPEADDRGSYRPDENEAAAMAQRFLDSHRSEARTVAFDSNVVELAPGLIISITDHPRGDLGENKRLLVIESTMVGKVGELKVHAEARRADVPFRPPLVTPKPKVSGVESATVVGPAGEEIHTDEFGRVRCHFHWDRESQMNEKSSCWIHVSQPWGGTGYGGVNLPRIGQEVIVDFLGGDPDRPIIVGRVYTNLQRVPYTLPANKTQSGWKSNSTNNTGGYNEMMFEDAAGQELLRIQAEKDLHKLVKNDEEHTVGHDRTRSVGRNESVTVRKNRTKQVAENERTMIGQNQSTIVGVNRTSQVGATDATSAGEKWVTVAANSASITVTENKIVLDTGAGATITLESNQIRIEADDLVDIHGKKRGVSLQASHPNGGIGLTSKKKFNVDADSVSIAGKTVGLSSPGKLSIDGAPVQINGPGQPAGRVGDAAGGTITTGSTTVLIGGPPSAPPAAADTEFDAARRPGPLGPFKTRDEAAKAALDDCNGKSIAENREYNGVIYRDPDTHMYYASDPQPGTVSGGDPPAAPPGMQEEGIYHTHGDYSLRDGGVAPDPSQDYYDSDHFSPPDRAYTQKRWQEQGGSDPNYRSYVGTPSGHYLQYNPKTGGTNDVTPTP